MKILMVCLGNICRSPLAEAILQHKTDLAGLSWKVGSAGTDGYHTGENPHPLSQKVGRLHGLDISQQIARLFVADDFARFDKIYAMAGNVIRDMKQIAKKKFDPNKVDLLMNEIYPGENMDIPDPYYGHEMGYHQAYEMMDKACTALVQKYIDETKSKEIIDQDLKAK